MISFNMQFSRFMFTSQSTSIEADKCNEMLSKVVRSKQAASKKKSTTSSAGRGCMRALINTILGQPFLQDKSD